MSWREWAKFELDALRTCGRARAVRDFDARGRCGGLGGKRVVSFASNDYLGLSGHPRVIAAARRALDRWGAGAGAARLVTGSRPVHSILERELAQWKGTERALLFATGYGANTGTLSALAGADVLVCSDELNHASIIDGCRLGRGRVAVYPHADVGALTKLLADAQRAVVVTDLVFSMDGDVAPVEDLVESCARYGALLVLDEAHAVLGPDPDLSGVEALRMGTCSKALGALGGFVAGPEELVELLVNRARPFVFSTAPPPPAAAAALEALRIVRSPEGDALRKRLRTLVDEIAPGHPSPVVPIVLGSEEAAVRASEALLQRGIFVPAIRPPTVPEGTARLRVTLSATHTDDEVALLADALGAVAPGWAAA